MAKAFHKNSFVCPNWQSNSTPNKFAVPIVTMWLSSLIALLVVTMAMAAAIAYGLDKKGHGSNIIVFDLGGGTFDVSLLTIDGEIEVQATAVDTHLGGQDFNNNIVAYFTQLWKQKKKKDVTKDKKGMGKLKREAEKAKKALSSQQTVRVEIDALQDGVKFVESLSRAKFEELNIKFNKQFKIQISNKIPMFRSFTSILKTTPVRAKQPPKATKSTKQFTPTPINYIQKRYYSTPPAFEDAEQTSGDNSKMAYLMVGSAGVLATVTAKNTVHDFLSNMSASADVLALAKVEIDLGAIPEASNVVLKWRGKPIFIRHRTQSEIDQAKSVALSSLRDPEADEMRASRPEWLVMLGVCTHLGCVPIGNSGDYGGWVTLIHVVLSLSWLSL